MNRNEEISAYVSQVRAALADLPAEQRDELLEDLPAHLAEVAAEGDEPLHNRLGTPEEYAAELRATVGIGRTRTRSSTRERLAVAARKGRSRLRGLDARVGPMLGYATASDYLRLLRPAWWVLRGYLAAMLVVHLLDDHGEEPLGLLPRLGGSELVALVMLAGFIVGSIWLGRRGDRFGHWPRRVLGATSVVLVCYAVIGFLTVDGETRSSVPVQYVEVSNDPFAGVTDLFVYDANGQLLRNVRIFDINGNEIVVPNPGDCHPMQPGYPHCPDLAPFQVPGTTPTPTPSPTAASPSPTPTPTR